MPRRFERTFSWSEKRNKKTVKNPCAGWLLLPCTELVAPSLPCLLFPGSPLGERQPQARRSPSIALSLHVADSPPQWLQNHSVSFLLFIIELRFGLIMEALNWLSVSGSALSKPSSPDRGDLAPCHSEQFIPLQIPSFCPSSSSSLVQGSGASTSCAHLSSLTTCLLPSLFSQTKLLVSSISFKS